MKTIITIITTFCVMASYSTVVKSALNDDLKECMIAVSDYNKGFPMAVGNGTTVNGVGCKVEENRVVLFYNSSIDTSTSNIRDISSLKNQRMTTACTSPKMRGILDVYDMEWIYYNSKNSSYMGSVKVKKENCAQ